jgi:hypothetical protein
MQAPASTMAELLRVHLARELKFFLEVMPCARCGRGPLAVRAARAAGKGPTDELPVSVRTHCRSCNAQRTFHIEWIKRAADQPSEVVDLAQWVGLYFLHADQIGKAQTPAESRAAARRAAQCLAEALKFYGPDEMPPESAFRKEQSLAAFRNSPANFARTRLRDLQAMLPVEADADQAEQSDDKPDDRPDARKAWWKLW